MFYKCSTNVLQIFCKSSTNLLQIFYKSYANIVITNLLCCLILLRARVTNEVRSHSGEKPDTMDSRNILAFLKLMLKQRRHKSCLI